MRKVIFALLPILLILSSCATNYVVQQDIDLQATTEAGVNLVSNGGFETGNLDQWGGSDAIAVSSAASHSGSYSLGFFPTGGLEYTYNVLTDDFNLDAGAVVSVWVKLPSAWEADKVTFIVEKQLNGGRNEYHKMKPEKTSDWQQLFIYVPPMLYGSVQDFVVKAEVNSARGPVYFDDFCVVSLNSEEINYIQNGSFTDRQSAWTNYNSSFGRDGRGALIYLDYIGGGIGQSTGFRPATHNPRYDGSFDAVFSAYVSPSANTDGIVRLRVERYPEQEILYRDFAVKSGSGWQKISMNIPASSTEVTEAVFYIESAGGTGSVMIDDVSLTVANFGLGSDGSDSFSGNQRMSADEVIKPYLTNGNLEGGSNGVSNNWGLAPGWEVLPYSYWTDRGDAYEGSGYVHVQQMDNVEQVFLQANGWQDRASTKSYDPSVPMIFKAWIQADGITGNGVYLRVERKYDASGAEQVLFSTSETIVGSTDGWIELSAYVEPSDIEFKEVLWDVVVSSGEGSVDIDYLTFDVIDASEVPEESTPSLAVGQNVLRNSELNELNADGSITHWDVWPGNPAEGIRNSEVITEEGRGNVLKINLETGNAQAVYQYCVESTAGKFDFDLDYTFSCDIKCEGLITLDGRGVTVGIKRRGIDGAEYNEYLRVDEMASGWNTWTLTPSPAPVEIVQYDVIVDIGAGIGSVYIDNFNLSLAEIAESVEEEIVLTWE